MKKGEVEGWFNEEQFHSHHHRSSTIQKAKKSDEKSDGRKHRSAIYGIDSSPGADYRGGILGHNQMSALLQKLTQPIYLAAVAIAMAGWVWMLFEALSGCSALNWIKLEETPFELAVRFLWCWAPSLSAQRDSVVSPNDRLKAG